jgi:flagellar basal-body rod protein FlgC
MIGGAISGPGPLVQAMSTSASGMRAQTTRLRIIAENLANVNSTAATPDGNPYQRKLITFRQEVDRQTGAALVEPGAIIRDERPFREEYDPANPAANAQGYYKLPNVSELVEQADMREAEHSYEANLACLSLTRSILTKILQILKG